MYAARAALLALLIPGLACVHRAPAGSVSHPDIARTEAWGAWVELEGDPGVPRGELIAVHADSVFVLSDRGLVAVSIASIDRARAFAYDYGHSTWTNVLFAGAVGTLSHGLLAVISMPIWFTVGFGLRAAAVVDSRIVDILPFETLSLLARFPRGLPPGLDRSRLQPRPPLGRGASSGPPPH